MTVKKTFRIENKFGIHARPAAMFVKTAGKFRSEISIAKDGLKANGKSIMGLMTLAAESGSLVEIIIDGEDANEAMNEIQDLIENNFYEDQ